MTGPRILICNDDGIHAEGLQTLARAAEPLGEVWIVAPASEQSAVSSAISLRHPLRVRETKVRAYSVSGTPTDCVYIALHHLLRDNRPDILLSGINHGANLGDDVIYSGTVAAAIEATLSDIPSIAFSCAGKTPYPLEETTSHIQALSTFFLEQGMPRGVFMNVNFPATLFPESERKITKLGRRNYGRIVVEKRDPRHQSYYWLGGAELGFDDLPGSDLNAVAAGHISVTPVHLDLTHYRYLRELQAMPQFQTDKGIPS